MREAELLNALSQTQGGIQVLVERGRVRIKTCYANPPHVTAEADSIFDAAFECASQVRQALNKYPSFRQFHPKLLEALEAYDIHSDFLSL